MKCIYASVHGDHGAFNEDSFLPLLDTIPHTQFVGSESVNGQPHQAHDTVRNYHLFCPSRIPLDRPMELGYRVGKRSSGAYVALSLGGDLHGELEQFLLQAKEYHPISGFMGVVDVSSVETSRLTPSERERDLLEKIKHAKMQYNVELVFSSGVFIQGAITYSDVAHRGRLINPDKEFARDFTLPDIVDVRF